MKQQIIFVACVMMVAVFASPAAAQRGHGGSGAGGGYGALGVPSTGTDTAGNKFEGYTYGIVKGLDKNAIVLTKTKAGTDETFKFTKKTKFIHDGKDSSLKALKLGDEVWVDADPDKKTGELIVRKVISGVFLMPSY